MEEADDVVVVVFVTGVSVRPFVENTELRLDSASSAVLES